MGKKPDTSVNEDNKGIIKNLTDEKNNLLKIISHDIRAPFNQIFALLQMFEMEFKQVSDDQRDYINRMYRAVLGGMEMIKNLHDVRSLENGIIAVSPGPVDLKKLIILSIRNFKIQCRIKNSEIRFEDSGSDVEIFSDNILISKILDNVFSNALKYSDPGSLTTVMCTQEKGKNIISVKDQGPGLSPDELKLIFNKFQRLSPKPTLGEATTGLGMYLAREFTDLLKGEITAENNPEGGLQVRIILN